MGWAVWTAYAFVQGTMFWALFCVGHDCGHQSFSPSKRINDVVGNIVHSAILVPYHPWRISHRKHHSNHGHVENDESWHPLSKSIYDGLDGQAQIGRFKFPIPLFAYPIYLLCGVPGKEGSHFDPNNKRLFQEGEKRDVIESTACFFGAVGALALAVSKFGLATVAKVYFAPYLCYILWLDAVTYLHHHGRMTTSGCRGSAGRSGTSCGGGSPRSTGTTVSSTTSTTTSARTPCTTSSTQCRTTTWWRPR